MLQHPCHGCQIIWQRQWEEVSLLLQRKFYCISRNNRQILIFSATRLSFVAIYEILLWLVRHTALFSCHNLLHYFYQDSQEQWIIILLTSTDEERFLSLRATASSCLHSQQSPLPRKMHKLSFVAKRDRNVLAPTFLLLPTDCSQTTLSSNIIM